MAKSISCSIVCYHNAPAQVSGVLDSIASAGSGVKVYLVDNSRDDSLRDVAQSFGATYLHLPHNPGFGAAHNIAIRQALAEGVDYHLVLNPDITFGGSVVPTLLDYMDENRDIGMLMPNVSYPGGEQQHLCKLLPTPIDLLIRRFFPILYQHSGRLARYEMHDSGYNKIMDVPVLSGCFMLIRASVLRDVGAFDERFFMYLEDVDLSRRISRFARTVYFPYVSVVHQYGKGSYKNLRLLSYHIRSAILYFNKWGWFYDREKELINQTALKKLHSE